MHLVLAEEIENAKAGVCSGDSWQDKWREAFSKCFVKVDAEIGGVSGSNPSVAPETVGSTAVVAIVAPTHIIVGNCGDSRAVLCRGKVAMPLSVDHKVCISGFTVFLIFCFSSYFIGSGTHLHIYNIVYVCSQIEKMNLRE